MKIRCFNTLSLSVLQTDTPDRIRERELKLYIMYTKLEVGKTYIATDTDTVFIAAQSDVDGAKLANCEHLYKEIHPRFTLVKTVNDQYYYVVHGVFGMGGRILDDEEPAKKLKKQIENAGGQELFKMFNTIPECAAYVQGCEDMAGWEEYRVTSTEEHKKVYGFLPGLKLF